MSWFVVVTTVGVVTARPAGTLGVDERPDWLDELEELEAPDPDVVPWEGSGSAEQVVQESFPPLESAARPEAGVWELDVPGDGEPAGAEGLPLEVAMGEGADADAGVFEADGERVRVEVFDPTAADGAGMSGFVFELADAEPPPGVVSRAAEADDAVLPLEIAIDYSGFAQAYGADFADRLAVVALPSCSLVEPLPEGCDPTGQRLVAHNDHDAGELVAEVDDLGELARSMAGAAEAVPADLTDLEVSGRIDPADGGEDDPDLEVPHGVEAGESDAASTPGSLEGASADGDGDGVMFGLMSSGAGDTGNYGATQLGLSGRWSAGSESGDFSYSHDFEVPDPPGGEAPGVALGYSSAAIDGLTSATNSQASQSGLGWSDFADAFIERQYAPCREVGGFDVDELCWDGQNAAISLGGMTGPLLPVDDEFDEWRAESDEGWKVERLTGADNGVNEGEHWKATAPDGTEYFFGLGEHPGGTSTHSAWGVPVWAAHSGEPCRADDDTVGACVQAWRWNLDRIVDPDGNVVSHQYVKERNYYEVLAGLGEPELYDRGGRLRWVDYGYQEGGEPSARVSFGAEYRCNDLNSACPAPNSSNANLFPDVPNDLICGSTDACEVPMPMFFTGKRYTHVRTEVNVDGDWEPVAQHNMHHVFRGPNSESTKLALSSIQHVGLTGDSFELLPPASFSYKLLRNRVDHADDTTRKMLHDRLIQVTNEAGGVTTVSYGQQNPCTDDYNPDRWDQNELDCFPQSVIDRVWGQDVHRTGVFNKYLVTEVSEDPQANGPEMTTTYEYEGAPAWGFNYGAFSQGDWRRGWTSWRGYGTVSVSDGSSTLRTRAFRGLDGDVTQARVGGTWCPCGEREETVESFDGEQSFADEPGLRGAVLEEEQLGTLDGQEDVAVQRVLNEYEHRQTMETADPDELRNPVWSGLARVTESIATAPGEFRQRRSELTYNEYFQVETTLEQGWLDEGEEGNIRCARTTYAENEDRWMFSYPASSTSYAGDCDSGEVTGVSEMLYDGSTEAGAPPSAGNLTTERLQVDDNTWSESHTEYDTFGRPVREVDPNGAASVTTYSPDAGIPTETAVTNDLGHTVVTQWDPRVQVPTRVEGANGEVTTSAYDGFGRVVSVRLPTEQDGGSSAVPSMRFSYSEDGRVVRSQQLMSEAMTGAGVVWEDTWVVYDGQLRERQVQRQGPRPGEVLVSETTYDDRGLVKDETVEQAVTADAGALITGIDWDNRTRTIYDDVGRISQQEWWRGPSAAHETTTSYGEDTVTVTPPEGGETRQRFDGFGRLVAVEEHDGDDWQTASYGYDLADQLVSVTTPEGSEISYTYNLAGWPLTVDDPDRGAASFGYDAAGNEVRVTDGEGNEIHTLLDELARPTERRSGSVDGELLASWDYDADGALGLLASETRHTSEGDWVQEITGYDGRDRPEGMILTVPEEQGALVGEYPISYVYDRADRLTEVTYPEVGGLPEETVRLEHTEFGHDTMSGLEDYVRATGYDDRGRPILAGYGPLVDDDIWMARNWAYDDDQRLASTETYIQGSPGPDGVASRHELNYDDLGNIVSQSVGQNEIEWLECYELDTRHRLVGAFTVEASDSCADGEPGTGPQPFEESYTYSPDGNLLERTIDGETSAYSYPGSDAAGPHAPTSVEDDTYTWDGNGNLLERTLDGETETFSWDAEQRLASVEGEEGEDRFVYDPSGQRLLRESDDGATLYFEAHEVHDTASGSVQAVRSYDLTGELVATRTPDGVSYLMGDPSGSVEMQAESGGAVDATRTYSPYGSTLDEDGETATDRGFLGQIEDSGTGLSYLQNRYYDTDAGIFISADPLYDTGQPKSLNPYSYGNNNPATFSDPDGLSAKEKINYWQKQAYHWKGQAAKWRASSQYWQGQAERWAVMAKTQAKQFRYMKRLAMHQQRQIDGLSRQVKSLTKTVWRQQQVIRRAKAHIKRLGKVIASQQVQLRRQARVIRVQQARIKRQQKIINSQAAQIRTKDRIINAQAARIRSQQAIISAQAGQIRALQAAQASGGRGDGGGSALGGGGGRGSGQVQFVGDSGGPPTSVEAYQELMGCEDDPASCPGGDSYWPWDREYVSQAVGPVVRSCTWGAVGIAGGAGVNAIGDGANVASRGRAAAQAGRAAGFTARMGTSALVANPWTIAGTCALGWWTTER